MNKKKIIYGIRKKVYIYLIPREQVKCQTYFFYLFKYSCQTLFMCLNIHHIHLDSYVLAFLNMSSECSFNFFWMNDYRFNKIIVEYAFMHCLIKKISNLKS